MSSGSLAWNRRISVYRVHTWDTLGAVAAGWEAALIKRAGNDVLAVGPQPQLVGPT